MIKIVIALIIDRILGDPYSYPHPVKYMGKLISFLDNNMRKVFKTPKGLKFAGFLTVIITVSVSFGVSYGLIYGFNRVNTILGDIVEIILIWNCIALRCLDKEIIKIYNSLKERDVEKARQQVSYLVSRDTNCLDEKGIVKAAVETAAENITDGIISPLFYIMIGGAPLGIAYKAINTLDSMIGYKNDKYIDFGFFGAKLDDVANFIPARLTGFAMVIFAFITGKDYKNGYRIMMRDHKKSKSPNAGWTESVVAGVMGIELCGPTVYFNKTVYKDTIGDNINEINYEHIKTTTDFMYGATLIVVTMGIIVAFLI